MGSWRREVWAEQCGGRGSLSLDSPLPETLPTDAAQISLTSLRLQADFINFFDCSLSLRYAAEDGADGGKWQRYDLEDGRVATIAELLEHVQAKVHSFRCEPVRSGGPLYRVWIEPSRGQAHLVVEFLANGPLAAILGLEPDQAYRGSALCLVNLDALTETVVVTGPGVVWPETAVGATELPSLGVWSGATRLSPLSAHQLAPALRIDRIRLSVVSLKWPAVPIPVSAYRISICLVIESVQTL